MASSSIFKYQNVPKIGFSAVASINKRFTSILSDDEKSPPKKVKKEDKIPPETKKAHTQRINNFFRKNIHLAFVRQHIPEKYLALKRLTPPENLYLIDSEVAKKAATYIIPGLNKNENQLVCETNAGLGFVTSELLNSGIKLVRLYEGSPEFKTYLKDKFKCYNRQVELFTKDIFLLHRYDYIDKQDHGSRVEQLLKGVPRKSWNDDPAMTIIGPLPNRNFIYYIIKSLVLQRVISSLGRLQLYAFMTPKDFIILTAGPHLNLHTYQPWSVLFNLFFDYQLLDKFPREVFLPWQSLKSQSRRFPGQVDTDLMYFAKITLKKDLPVSAENLLPFYSFVRQFFGKGKRRVIPVLEKWVPGSGLDVMVPKQNHTQYFKNLNIFTKFGELNPQQILAVFEEMISHPEYRKSHFVDLIESHLIQTETIETSMDEHLEKTVIESVDSIDNEASL